MFRKLSRKHLLPSVAAMVSSLVMGSVAVAQAPQSTGAPKHARFGQAEVTANDVYVRSGPSSNHYPVLKLAAGSRVTVVGERGAWYEIEPPEGAFSFIHADYVDTADHQHGVVNGDNVRVRAGSAIPPYSKLKYTVQTKLSKGAEVTILQREPEGFLRIVPPEGVTLWISRKFVQLVPDSMVRLEGEMEESAVAGDAGSRKNPPIDVATAVPTPDTSEPDRKTVFGGMAVTEQRRKLEELDQAVRAELEKPVLERNFAPLVQPYQAIAAQDEDGFARRYAQGRIEQITNMAALIDTVRKIRGLDEEANARRRAFLEARAKIAGKIPPIPSGIDVQGELRLSALYPPGSSRPRYRLVEPSGASGRTIGYVEIPPDAEIDVDVFLGRYVGVRASGKRLQQGGVDPVPIYVADELVLLQQAPTATKPARGD